MTRRRLIKSAAWMAAAAAASTLMPPNVRRALAQDPPKKGSLKDIKHLVFLMQENRSFDHYFGTMAGVRGFSDPNAMMLKSGNSVFYQPDAQSPRGYMLPFHLDTTKTNAQKIPSTSHAWGVQHSAWNKGKMDNWLPAHRKADGVRAPYCMGYYTRNDIPFQFALAEAFTLCDAYHCSLMGPTWPNRMYWMTGMIDPHNTGGGPITHNHVPTEGYRWTTYAERLEKAGVSWKVFHEQDSYGCNMLYNFKTFRDSPIGSPLHTKALQTGPKDEFEQAAKNDKLPTVSWLIPTSYQSEHPDHLPAAGAAFVASKIDAIASNPEVWAKTAFVLDYDENDGLFDHVAPPVPPAGTPDEFIEGVPIGAGFRVPCIVVSPWTVGGWVCSQQFDHTSVLQLAEKVTGVIEPNISAWRRKTFGDLTSTFRFNEEKSSAPKLPDAHDLLGKAIFNAANLPVPKLAADTQLPTQEKGKRKRVPEGLS